ncbi:hypothetical protein KVR01_001106 [Diaporthe batatas]|uniref:uncharacterized protein n=1 Tax=Diaporthe batatas TaxID=748121 RepID=UPI001D04089B|nr:uncharacterized protein KVR01_001106 [Diaporthe batatas]KAG8168357.1 hypothetical protein KVR01_001106 [Diaporthe batatas]
MTETERALVDDKAVVDGLAGGIQRYLVASPYPEADHLLDLETLDAENQLLAEALLGLRCRREDYATAAYADTFNWDEVVGRVRELAAARNHRWRETSWYIVAFRSRYESGIDYSHLGDLDKAAHAEATASGGFLKYWFGTPDQNLRNLATCIWRSREDARKGGTGPAHKEAIRAVRTMYAEWRIDQHRLIVRDGVSSWDLVQWTD